jgi:fructose-1,6-bisphosphatase-3
MDAADRAARDAFYAPLGSDERRRGQSILWFLWCGKNSPLSARERITSFERSFIADPRAHAEPKNAYLNLRERQDVAARILAEFSLDPERGHIINGHTPIRRAKGESPIKAGGRVIVIDGGFCSAYHKKTGIAGYTLIYNAEGMRILAHRPFPGTEAAVRDNLDIHSEITVFEVAKNTITVGEIEN